MNDSSLMASALSWNRRGEILFSLVILHFPPVQAFLGTGPVSPRIYALAWAGAPLIFALDWRASSSR